MTSELTPERARRLTLGFLRWRPWIVAFTTINALSLLVSLGTLDVVGMGLSGLMVWAGVRAWQAGGSFAHAQQSGHPTALLHGLRELEDYYRISTIGAGIALALMVLLGVLLLLLLIVLLSVGPEVLSGRL